MRPAATHHTNCRISHQSTTDTGAAKTTPRAKPPRRAIRSRTLPERAGGEESFSVVALAIWVIDLLLLARKLHSTILGLGRTGLSLRAHDGRHRARSRPLARTKRLNGERFLDRLVQEVQDLLFLACLAALPRQRTRGAAYEAISIRQNDRRDAGQGLVLRTAAFACLALCAPRVALAQEADVVTPVDLFDPDSGQGARLSPGFVLYPRADVAFVYDSNIYNVENGKIDDALVSIRPALALRSDFSRHAVSIEADAEVRRYLDVEEENSEQYRIQARTLLELGYAIDVNAYAAFARGIEQRGSAGDLFFTDEPIVYHDKRAGIEVSRMGRRLELEAGASILKRDYADTLRQGVPVDLSIRDVEIRSIRFRAYYGLNGKTRVFGELSGNEIDYDLSTSPSRNSSGYAALVGLRHQVTALIDVEAGVGFIRQDFDNPAVESASEVNYRLVANWTPSPQWKLTASASRVVDASRTEESPAIVATEYKLAAQRAIGDRLLVGAEAGYLTESFEATPREDRRFFVSGSATYRVTDRIGAVLAAGLRDQDGGNFGRSYSGFSASIGVRAAW